MIKIRNLNKVFAAGEVRTRALNGISLDIEAGEYVAVTGPSGCGKSTLLSVVGLLDIPTSGEYWFEGVNVADRSEADLNRLRRGRVGFIFQSFNLIEELTVGENVALALDYSSIPVRERKRRTHEFLEKLGVAHRSGHRPSQLSGGQQQRVAIARALIAGPALLLADEPTGNLDTAHGDEVMKMLRTFNAEGTTIIMVTHSRSHAAQASRTIDLLDGKIVVDAQQMA